MPILLIVFATLFIASTTLNLMLFRKLKKKTNRPQSVELQEFLVDLMSGGAMIAVARVDPNGILLRSPKR